MTSLNEAQKYIVVYLRQIGISFSEFVVPVPTCSNLGKLTTNTSLLDK